MFMPYTPHARHWPWNQPNPITVEELLARAATENDDQNTIEAGELR